MQGDDGKLLIKQVEVLDVRGRVPYQSPPSADPHFDLASNHIDFADLSIFTRQQGSFLHPLPELFNSIK